MSAESELEQARRDYAADPDNRANRLRLATLNESAATVDAEYAGLACAPSLLVHGTPNGAQGKFDFDLPKGFPKLEMSWRSLRFSTLDEQLGDGFFDPFGIAYLDVLSAHDRVAADKSAAEVMGYALVQFTLDGELLPLLKEEYNISRFWDDGSEAGDTNFAFPGPRLSCSGTWLALAALAGALPRWEEELRLPRGYRVEWKKGYQEGQYSLQFTVEYIDPFSTMPCVQFQNYNFDFNDRSYTYRHSFAPTRRRDD